MTQEPTTVEKLRGLPWSIATNAANTVFSQFTFFGSAFVLFLSELALTKSQIGFTLSLVPFAALVAPFVATYVSRHGYKRIFVIYYGARKAVTMLLLLTPWVLATFGAGAAFPFVALVTALFSLARAVEETAYYPWVQEFVPNFVRGKYSATSNMITALIGFFAVSAAGLVLSRNEGLAGFMILFAVGVIFGFLSVWASIYVPGGAPHPEEAQAPRQWRRVLQDGDFRRYLVGLGLITLGTVPLASFLPLFMQEEVGLSDSYIVLVQLGTLLGSLSSSYLWGWAADRYGSKPIMLTGLAMLSILPLLWWFMPRQVSWSLYVALAIAFYQGVANLGWGIGAGRLLFVTIVPTDVRTDYLALYFAFAGTVAGISQLLGGRALDYAERIASVVDMNPYLPLFVAALVFPLLCLLVMRRLRSDGPFSTVQVAGVFLRGNPFSGMASMIRFYRAKDEHDTVLMTERMAQTRSPLTIDELLEALADPRFNVRFEAILAISRMPADQRLTQALVGVLNGKSPALGVVAAWALGRIGDPAAVAPLRDNLQARYRSVQAHSARSLATLGDHSVAPLLLQRLDEEEDEGLRLAYASALGKLAAPQALRPLLTLLRDSQDEASRMELALAVARIVGDERQFIQLLRGVRARPGTTASQTVSSIRKLIERRACAPRPALADLDQCAEEFAREELDSAVAHLSALVERLAPACYHGSCAEILEECAWRLRRSGMRRVEYVLLALHTLAVGIVQEDV